MPGMTSLAAPEKNCARRTSSTESMTTRPPLAAVRMTPPVSVTPVMSPPVMVIAFRSRVLILAAVTTAPIGDVQLGGGDAAGLDLGGRDGVGGEVGLADPGDRERPDLHVRGRLLAGVDGAHLVVPGTACAGVARDGHHGRGRGEDRPSSGEVGRGALVDLPAAPLASGGRSTTAPCRSSSWRRRVPSPRPAGRPGRRHRGRSQDGQPARVDRRRVAVRAGSLESAPSEAMHDLADLRGHAVQVLDAVDRDRGAADEDADGRAVDGGHDALAHAAGRASPSRPRRARYVVATVSPPWLRRGGFYESSGTDTTSSM